MKFKFIASVLALTLTSVVKAQSDSLVAYYPFSGNANDFSGNNHHGDINGPILTEDRFGNPDNAYWFDGGDDHINIAETEMIHGISEQITISAWVKPNSQYYNTIVSKGGGSSSFMLQFAKFLRPGVYYKGLDIDYNGAEDYWGRVLPFTTVEEAEWVHIATTYSNVSNQALIYVNGTLIHSSPATGDILTESSDLRIGARINTNYPEYFSGSIDEVVIYSRALSADEINELYQEPLSIHTIDKTDHVDINIYPNPTKDNIYLTQNADKVYHIVIKDITGKTLKSIKDSSNGIHISDLPSGMYFLDIKVKDSETILTKKVVKL